MHWKSCINAFYLLFKINLNFSALFSQRRREKETTEKKQWSDKWEVSAREQEQADEWQFDSRGHTYICTFFQPLPLFTQLEVMVLETLSLFTQPELKVCQPLLHLTQPELKAFQPLPLYTRAELKGFQPFQLFTQTTCKPKAQVSLFDWNLSVVCCWGIVNIKLFTFSSHFIAA